MSDNQGGLPVAFAEIQAAAELLAGHVASTPVVESPSLSQRTGATVLLKLENLQHTGSFKARGALVRLSSLSPEETRAGVIAMSAGNHAQGVAYHAARLGVPATIVMPKTTPFSKVGRTAAYGARVLLEGEGLSEAWNFAQALAEREGLCFVHPYDDPAIIAGQGTVGLEMLTADPDLDALIVPIGGGGLIAGIAVAAKALKPAIEIIGVEAAAYPSMYDALHGRPPASGGPTIAEGIAVKTPGRLTRPVVERLVADILLVEEDAIECAVQSLAEDDKIVAEGAAATAVAALLIHADRFRGRRAGLVVSGGNIDSRLLASILMRGLARVGRIIRLRIEISDAPGALAKVAQLIGTHDGNIIEVYHQRLFYDIPVKMAEIDVVVETRNEEHVQELMDRLRESGFPVRLLSSRAFEGNA